MEEKKAFITLLSSENYLEAVLVLNSSLRENKSKYPLVVAVTENIFIPEIIEPLKKHHIFVEKIPLLEYCSFLQEEYAEHSVLKTASKIAIFSLKNWDKLVYIDADTCVLKNVDELFDYPDGAMLYYKEEQQGFSGLFVFEPKLHQEDEFYPTLIKHHYCFDGDLLGKIWFFVKTSIAHQIPDIYFWHYNPNMAVPEGIKIIHYCNADAKLWMQEEIDPAYYSNWIYKYHLDKIRNS